MNWQGETQWRNTHQFKQYFNIIDYCRNKNPLLIKKHRLSFLTVNNPIIFYERLSLSVGQNILWYRRGPNLCSLSCSLIRCCMAGQPKTNCLFQALPILDCWSHKVLGRENAHFPKQMRCPHQSAQCQLSTEIAPQKLMLFNVTDK